MVDVYSTEPERQAALAEVTRLRRQFDTTTAKGAKEFAKDKEAQAAIARLDAAKKAAGMRTSKEDLAALNRIATSDTATMKKQDGKMVPAPTKGERAVTKELNAPSKQYFKQFQQAYKNPDKIPTWQGRTKAVGRGFTQEDIEFAKTYNVDLSGARLDWVWYEPKDDAGNPIEGEASWRLGVIGGKKIPKDESQYLDKNEYVTDLFASDRITLGEWAARGGGAKGPKVVMTTTSKKPNERQEYLLGQARNEFYRAYNPFSGMLDPKRINELTQALPELKYTEIQEILYRLTLDKDTDITVEDMLDKYDELYGEG